jgi:hypothetical protein
MKTTTTLLLAGFAALSLGVGVANAQSLAPSSAEGAYYAGQRQSTTMPMNRGAMAGQNQSMQYGSSDPFGNGRTVPFDTNSVAGGF